MMNFQRLRQRVHAVVRRNAPGEKNGCLASGRSLYRTRSTWSFQNLLEVINTHASGRAPDHLNVFFGRLERKTALLNKMAHVRGRCRGSNKAEDIRAAQRRADWLRYR